MAKATKKIHRLLKLITSTFIFSMLVYAGGIIPTLIKGYSSKAPDISHTNIAHAETSDGGDSGCDTGDGGDDAGCDGSD